jgi:hypothetical protein
MPPKEIHPSSHFNRQDFAGLMHELHKFIDGLAHGMTRLCADPGRELIKEILAIYAILVVTLAPGMFFE